MSAACHWHVFSLLFIIYMPGIEGTWGITLSLSVSLIGWRADSYIIHSVSGVHVCWKKKEMEQSFPLHHLSLTWQSSREELMRRMFIAERQWIIWTSIVVYCLFWIAKRILSSFLFLWVANLLQAPNRFRGGSVNGCEIILYELLH